jgi:ABC-type sugar transport system substrate-binding protein
MQGTVRQLRAAFGGTRRAGLSICALAAASALVAAGCGNSTTTTTSSSPSSSAAVSAATISAFKAKIATAEQVPSWTAPGPAVSASVLKGKSLLVFPINSEIDACNTQAEDFKALGTELGAHVTYIPNQGVPTQWVTGVQDGVSAHDAAIAMLCGIVPGAVGPELKAAASAGIKIVDGNYNETSDYTGLDGETAVTTAQSMVNDVDYAVTQLDGKALHAIVVTSTSVIQGPAAQAAADGAVTAACKTCSVDENINIPVQDWVTSTAQSDMSSALLAHPDANAVIVAFDGIVPGVMPAVEAAHRAGLKIYTWGGSRSVEELMLKPNSVVAADAGPNEDWDAYEAMDQVIRLLGGHPSASVNSEVDPDRFWVPSNVSQFFGPGDSYGNAGYGGNAFIDGFRKLWGLSS